MRVTHFLRAFHLPEAPQHEHLKLILLLLTQPITLLPSSCTMEQPLSLAQNFDG